MQGPASLLQRPGYISNARPCLLSAWAWVYQQLKALPLCCFFPYCSFFLLAPQWVTSVSSKTGGLTGKATVRLARGFLDNGEDEVDQSLGNPELMGT